MHPAMNIKRTVHDKNLRVEFSSITAWQEEVGRQFTVRRLHMFAVRGRLRECGICGGGGAGDPWNWVYAGVQAAYVRSQVGLMKTLFCGMTADVRDEVHMCVRSRRRHSVAINDREQLIPISAEQKSVY